MQTLERILLLIPFIEVFLRLGYVHRTLRCHIVLAAWSGWTTLDVSKGRLIIMLLLGLVTL